ncbi:Aminotransferase, class I and II [Sulfurimonas denitrificans DSM 1251]|uniref:cysteine-S-conjugate beta-lyase n=1 Tax=Sulfurimonas denitrificans (strain ATCC 33889 / DSM 1251) TaxID=326298 RepID=Q30TC0_SULDN|nr:PatB family C-S lyase [Sulfurimonas denitrificans]ABB43761.1 Aminotransferase, class I and II [Sulfurimonas denitrificans DSM 1251]MDD3442431.1 PatB family C-S lyase [Sulfurimonas denitrificans]
MKYTFQTSTCRENTNAEKYVLREKLFGTNEVMPLWVADMDIDTPDFVLDAVRKRLEHQIVGYEELPQSAFLAQIEWMKKEHGVEFALEEMLYSHSVVASMNVAIEAFTEKGDKVIVQTPVYPPFFHSVIEHERELLKNPLKLRDDGTYTFDIEDLKSKINEKTKLLLLCSPHNPVGRVWRREELEQILELCVKHNIVVFSDEIHSDLVYAPNVHIPFASLSADARDITVTAIGIGKSFNMAGFAISSVAIQNKILRENFLKVYNRTHFANGSTLSHVAFEAAYRDGKEWLEELKIHLYKNFYMLDELCKKYPHYIKLTPIEGTYLAWLDCRGLGFGDRELRDFFIHKAGLGLSAGISFGREGSGFMRLNFAISSDKMLEVIKKLDEALLLKCRQ